MSKRLQLDSATPVKSRDEMRRAVLISRAAIVAQRNTRSVTAPSAPPESTQGYYTASAPPSNTVSGASADKLGHIARRLEQLAQRAGWDSLTTISKQIRQLSDVALLAQDTRTQAMSMGDIALVADSSVPQADKLGVFELIMEGDSPKLVQQRPVYKLQARNFFLFFAGESWMVGQNMFEAKGCWKTNSTAMTAHGIKTSWQASRMLHDHRQRKWITVKSAHVMQRSVFENHVQSEAMATGDLALYADNAPCHSNLLGIYELCNSGRTLTNGRPVYKLQGYRMFLFFSGRAWMVGSDVNSSKGCWVLPAHFFDITPCGAIGQWRVSIDCGNDSTWIDVKSATVITRASFECRMQAKATAYGDVALRAHDATLHVGKLGVFQLQNEGYLLVHGRPIYKLSGHKQMFLFFNGDAWIVGTTWQARTRTAVDGTTHISLPPGGFWMARSGALTPEHIEAKWQVFDSRASEWKVVKSAGIITRGEYETGIQERARAVIMDLNQSRRGRERRVYHVYMC